MSHWFVYLIVMLGGIKSIIGLLAFLSVIVLIVFGIVFAFTFDEDELRKHSEYKIRKTRIISGCITVFALLSIVITAAAYNLVPNTKQAAAIYLIPKVVNSEQVQDIGNESLEIPEKGMKILNRKMDQYIEELEESDQENSEGE